MGVTMVEQTRYHQTPSVAILSQSDRTDRITNPLTYSKIPFDVDSANPYEHDILIVETPDREMFKEVLKRPLHDTQVLFRMRGDPYWGIDEWIGNGIKRQLALRMLKYVDGCVALAPHQAEKYVTKTGNPTHIVPLSIDTREWPSTNHTDEELRILSLTNCMYPRKVDPIIDAAPVVEDVLADVGGYWRIGGKGRHEDKLRKALKGYTHVEFGGYVDAKEELRDANLMLHLSQFDSFANAIMEGSASTLPVITTDYVAFTDHNLPVETISDHDDLRRKLLDYRHPVARQGRGHDNEAHIAEYYNHQRVGRAWQRAILDFYRKRSLPGGVLESAREVCEV